MQRVIAPLLSLGPLALGVLAIAGGTASAASPEFCALYAQEYVDRYGADAKKEGSAAVVHDRAYYRCLNQDDEPKLPVQASAGNGGDNRDSVAVTVGSKVGSTKAETKPQPEEVAKADPGDDVKPVRKASGRHRGSGFAHGSKEWVAWCSAHYKSFDPKTGYYKPFSGSKTLCK
jgi:hypothetical protein